MTDVEDGGAKYSEKISDYDMKDEIARKLLIVIRLNHT
jgi:hypothetical protein